MQNGLIKLKLGSIASHEDGEQLQNFNLMGVDESYKRLKRRAP
ncbi:hypothetical protein 268TH004_57 [Bacillus phage 268TH004]|uniref:Uncharacterized protein n=1 Tax=Bacillus phage 268TH004 TaxID=2801523 RepID=A0A7T7ZAS1_9CAUD|nr:hypothetical protein 268TH004_57 [Bacillus phage 268TH004]